MIRKRYLFPLLLCLCLTSCAPVAFMVGAAAGIGGYKYYQGALTIIYQAPYARTWDASIKALEEMGITIESKKQDLTTGKIVAIRADNKPVTISLKYVSSDETEVTIRVGHLGDENASNVIKDKIRVTLFK